MSLLSEDALAVVAVLAKRAGGRVSITFDEADGLAVMLDRDENGLTATLVDPAELGRATQKEAAAAVAHATKVATRLEDLLDGAARAKQALRFVD